METVRQKLIGIPLHTNEISAILGELISVNFRADVIHAEAQQVDVGDINVAACYDADLDSMDRPCIELTLVYSNLDSYIVIDDELFELVTRRLCDSISHEQIHQQQHRARFWESWFEDDEDPVIYLGNKDEIDAYSHNIANELLDYTDYQNALTLLQNPTIIKLEQSVNLWAYIQTFGNAKHPVVKRLIKKIVRRLPNVVYER